MFEKIFEKVFEKKRKMRILKQSASAEKVKWGKSLGFLELQFAAKYHKT